MSELSDTSAIDEKKKETETSGKSDFFGNVGNFLWTVLILFILICLYYACSALTLFSCKLGQSNILPTDAHCFPYEETKANIQQIKTNIFSTLTEPALSMKMSFPLSEYNLSNKILDLFRDYKNEPNSNFLANYFISILEKIIQFNYSSFNTFLNMLNSLPEIILIIFGPVIVGILLTLIFIFDHLYLIYLWFSNMDFLFKSNKNTSGSGKPKWENVTFIEPFNFSCAVGLIILLTILFFFCFPFLSVIAFLSMSWCVFSCFAFKAEMFGKDISALTIIQDVFKYYKLPIMSIFSFFVVVSAFSKLGTLSGVFSILILALIYFGIIAIDMFKPINKENLSALSSLAQAKKTCLYNEPIKEKHALLYNVLFGQKGGKNFIKELKNIGKKLSQK
jgi:hypothetical protein